MLIPIGTDVVHRRQPTVTYFLIAINILLFAIQWATIRNGGMQSNNELIRNISALYSQGSLSGADFHVYSLITYQFIHASWWHVLGNMIFLFPFGKAVEDRMGHLGFAVFYIGSGMLCGGLHALLSSVPVIGASGSVCAVTAAFLVLAPKTQIKVLFVFFLIAIIKIPSLLFILFFVLFDTFGLIASAAGVSSAQTAWVVHLGGYLCGFLVAWFLLITKLISSTEYDLPTMIRQFNRRSQYKSVVERVRSEIKSSDEPVNPTLLLKATISQLFVSGQEKDASTQYLDEIEKNKKFCLDKKTQLAMANYLISNEEIENGCRVFEQFLKVHPESEESSEVALLLSAKYIRVLNQADQAKKLLKKYNNKFSEKHLPFVQTLTQEMGA